MFPLTNVHPLQLLTTSLALALGPPVPGGCIFSLDEQRPKQHHPPRLPRGGAAHCCAVCKRWLCRWRAGRSFSCRPAPRLLPPRAPARRWPEAQDPFLLRPANVCFRSHPTLQGSRCFPGGHVGVDLLQLEGRHRELVRSTKPSWAYCARAAAVTVITVSFAFSLTSFAAPLLPACLWQRRSARQPGHAS